MIIINDFFLLHIHFFLKPASSEFLLFEEEMTDIISFLLAEFIPVVNTIFV